VCLAVPSLANAKQVIKLWSYYEFPPFVISVAERNGLTYDFVEKLNLFEDTGEYQFEVEILPRKRLNAYLDSTMKGAVLWVNPLFFGDLKRKRYLWTNPILEDEQAFISRVQTPFLYTGPESLMKPDFVLGGMRGHVYGGIQKQIDEGKIIRSDVDKEKQNIGMLLKKRVNTFLIPRSAMIFYEQQLNLTGKIYYSPRPLISFTRNILVKHDLNVFEFLSGIVNNFKQDDYWQALLDQYGLSLPTGKKTDF